MHYAPSPAAVQEGNGIDNLLDLAFGLGWAAADHAHIPTLPEALARLLGVPAARMTIAHWNGSFLMKHAFPPIEERVYNGPMVVYEAEETLGTQYALRIVIETATELTPEQGRTFQKAVRLIRQALDCILIRQQDRHALGEPFARLSDKEWQICLALERPDGEKQIAASLGCSPHTVHGYVKKLYRILQAQSRLQVLDHLKNARDHVRRRTLEGFASVQSAHGGKNGLVRA